MTDSAHTSEADTEPLPQSLADAIECYDQGDIEGCRALLAGARRETEPDVPVQLLLFEGLCERRAGSLLTAVERLREAAALAADDPSVLLELGLAVIETGNSEEGLDLLRQAVHASGDAPWYRHEFYLQNAIALYGGGFLEPAISSLRKALKFERDVDTFRLLGHLLLEYGKQDEALDTISEAIRHFPNDAELHHVAGLALAVKRQPFDAAQAFTRAIELDPMNGDPLHSLGLCFESLSDVSRAIEAYDRCLRLECSEVIREDARQRLERLRALLNESP